MSQLPKTDLLGAWSPDFEFEAQRCDRGVRLIWPCPVCGDDRSMRFPKDRTPCADWLLGIMKHGIVLCGDCRFDNRWGANKVDPFQKEST